MTTRRQKFFVVALFCFVISVVVTGELAFISGNYFLLGEILIGWFVVYLVLAFLGPQLKKYLEKPTT